jgi:putative ABC transport system permease protein
VAPSTLMFAVKTTGDPQRFVDAVRTQVLAIDRDQPISSVHTMTEIMEQSEGQRRLVLMLLEVFAGSALLLTLVGIYGMIAYWVVQRTRELGIRRALGARDANLLWVVIGRGFALTLAGVIAGTAGALALTRLMETLLFQVSPTDPLTFGAVATALVLFALAACYVPARRATRIDPMEALRTE